MSVAIGRGAGIRGVLPLMEVSSRLTGRRGVGLPFTDFCEALDPCAELYAEACALGRARGWRYLELRGDCSLWPGAVPGVSYWTHTIDLTEGAEAAFKRFAPSVRRAIRKAGALELQADCGASLDHVWAFYRLHCSTRRRHGLPPQPFKFFSSIADHLLGKGRGTVIIVRQGSTPVAGAVFLDSGTQAVFKFGASDRRFQHTRPNNLVMWAAVQHYSAKHFTLLHLGRTSLGNQGLRRFKLGFGASETPLQYYRFDFRRNCFTAAADRATGWHNRLFRRFPMPVLRLAGRMLYPHLS